MAPGLRPGPPAARVVLRGAVALAILGSAFVVGRVAAPPPGPTIARPNIVVILTDDQRADTLSAMPVVQERIVGRGATFANAFVVNSLCCPSRATILTGQYSHTTGVWRNRPPHGGFAAFDDTSTIATRLDAGGYTTALIGKYLNGYWGTYVPPGWDRFVAFSGLRPYEQRNLYYDYTLNVDGTLEAHQDLPEDYSTGVLAARAEEFIRSTPGPLFLLFAPFAPHRPAIAAPGDEGAFASAAPHRPPSHDEADVTEKPGWVRDLARYDEAETRRVDELRLDQLRTLVSIDRAVARILDTLEDTGRMGETLVVFTSDNGYSWGEHRWSNKQTPYDQDLRVPLVIRYDPVTTTPFVNDDLVLNMDLAPTFAALAGVPIPRADGRSLLELLGNPDGVEGWRTDFLFEHMLDEKPPVPTYCGVRTRDAKYVVYANGDEELYDLASDPFELDNLAADPRHRADREAMRERLAELCDPPPPGLPRRLLGE